MGRAWRYAVTPIAIGLFAACIGAPTAQPDATATASPAPTDRPVTTPTPASTPTLIPQPADKAPVSFARADFTHGTSAGVTGTGPITLAASGLTGGTYDDPFGARGIAFQSGSVASQWSALAVPFDAVVATANRGPPPRTLINAQMAGVVA